MVVIERPYGTVSVLILEGKMGKIKKAPKSLVKKAGKQKKIKLTPFDGLGPYEVAKIRSALRQVWHRSKARKIVVTRCTDIEGYVFCECCYQRTPKILIDHITKCGNVDAGYISRLFIPSMGLQGMCKKCHDEKTKKEKKACL